MTHDVRVVPMITSHWPHVESIYSDGIRDGHATFESGVPAWSEFDGSRLDEHRFVAVDRLGAVVGWIACSPVSARPVYAGVVEHSVYVSPSAQGRGVGGLLLSALIESTEAAGIWTIQSSIFGENVASLNLHARHGFRIIGTRERIAMAVVGPAAGRWRDTILVERRSAVAGCD